MQYTIRFAYAFILREFVISLAKNPMHIHVCN